MRWLDGITDWMDMGLGLGVMQGDIWSRCLTDAASKRRGGQSLGRETTGGEVEVLQENRRHTETRDVETQAE